MEESVRPPFLRRVLSWIVIAVVAIIAVKLAFGLVVSFFMGIVSFVVVIGLVLALFWAVRRL
jgi:membrane-bound ClpP family serine protease